MSVTRMSLSQKWDGQISREAVYEYALVYMASELRLIPCEKWESIDLEECLEVRFFCEKGELHIFREEDAFLSAAVQDLSGGDEMTSHSHEDEKSTAASDSAAGRDSDVQVYATIDRVHSIRKNCRGEVPGCTGIIVREYIGYDADGQAYTVRTRLAGLI